MANINKINDSTYTLEEDGVRFFLLIGDGKAAMIDTGMNSVDAKRIGESITDKPIILINTHGDPDHISGNDQFAEVYINKEELDNYKLYNHKDTKFRFVEDNEIIDLGNRPLKIIFLQGHTPGSIAILDINNRVLISGDSIQDGRVYMFGEMRNINLYHKTLNDLYNNHLNEFDSIYPSHGSLPVSKDLIKKLIDGSKKIIDKQVEGQIINLHNHEIRYVDLGYAGFLLDKETKN